MKTSAARQEGRATTVLADAVDRWARDTQWSGGWFSWLLQIAILLVVAIALLWPAPIQPNALPAMFTTSDLLLSHWPSELLIKRTIAQSHHLPIWNPYYGGRPLAGDPVAALFYPPTLLVTVLPLRDYFLALLLGHLVWGGLGMLVLARRALHLPPLAGLAAAIAFMGAPRLIGHLGAGHLTMIQAAAWLPWVALTTWLTVQCPWRWGPWLAVSFALMLLAGHPQIAYYGALMAVGVALWALATRWRAAGRRALLAALVGLGAAAGTAGLLAAVHLLPLLEFTAHSTRQHAISSNDSLALGTFLRAILGYQIPSPVPWEVLFEPGAAVLALAVLGLALRPRAALPLVLGVVLVAGLALGLSSPVYRLAAVALPDLDRFRGLARIWFVALLPIALLAGLGLTAVMHRLRRVWRDGATLVGVLGVLLITLNLTTIAQGLTQVGDSAALTHTSVLARVAAKYVGDGRIYGVQRNISQLSAVQLKLELADGQDPLLIEPYASFMQRAGGYTLAGYHLSIPPFEIYDPGYPTSRDAQPDATLLGLFDVRVVLSRTPLTDPHLVAVDKVNGVYLYRNEAAAGPAYMVAPGPGGVPPAPDRLQRLAATVTETSHDPERQAFAVTTSAAGFLVIAAPAYPGWVARLDGRTVPLQTLDGVLPAVAVGPGTHQVSYTYAPFSLRLGTALSVLGIVICLAWFLVGTGWLPSPFRSASNALPKKE